MTNFEKLSASPEALAAFLTAIPVANSPWDDDNQFLQALKVNGGLLEKLGNHGEPLYRGRGDNLCDSDGVIYAQGTNLFSTQPLVLSSAALEKL